MFTPLKTTHNTTNVLPKQPQIHPKKIPKHPPTRLQKFKNIRFYKITKQWFKHIFRAIKETYVFLYCFCVISCFFFNFPLWLKNVICLVQVRYLHEISSLEPVPKVWKTKSRSKNAGLYIDKEI